MLGMTYARKWGKNKLTSDSVSYQLQRINPVVVQFDIVRRSR